MRIGTIAYINPAEFKEYLFQGQDIPCINRAASSVNAITLGFLSAGHQVTVVSSYDDKGPVVHLKGDKLNIYLVSSFSSKPKASTFKRWYMVGRLKNELANHIAEMDVIHTHWTYDFAVAAAAFAKQVPVFCTIRDWAPTIRRLQANAKARFMWWLISEALFRRVMNNKDIHLIANSSYIYQLVKNAYPYRSCEIIGNPIKKDFIIDNRVSPSVAPVIVSIAQDITELRKNYISLLKAFQILLKEYPQARLQLIGIYNKQKLRSWDHEGLTANVEFIGFTDHDAIIGLLDNASVLVHPSLEESFGNTLLEGMARRIPVIGGKDSGAVPFVLGHGKYGLLCDVTDPQDIARTMVKALNVEQMRPMLDHATAYLRSELSNEVIAQKHIDIFQKHQTR